MKIHRLMEIVTVLLNRGSVTAGELAQRFEVSTRTIYRDIEALSESGVPVYMRTGSGGGISLMDNYTLQKSLISKEESENLLLALKTLQAANFPEMGGVLNKMGALFRHSDTPDWVAIDFSNWGSRPDAENKFARIKEAILNHQVMEFDYVNADGGKSRRQLEPMRILFKSQTWYVWGFCRLRQEFRIFRFSRMRNLAVLKESFEPRGAQYDEGEGAYPSKPIVNIRLRFSPEMIFRVFDDFDEGFITRNTDGTVDVNVEMPEGEWIYSYILSFVNGVEVLSPEHVREGLRQRIQNLTNIYNMQFE